MSSLHQRSLLGQGGISLSLEECIVQFDGGDTALMQGEELRGRDRIVDAATLRQVESRIRSLLRQTLRQRQVQRLRQILGGLRGKLMV